ncbi:MIP family channel protein [Streptomyces flaveolus]|uniref:MIP family channel protein n=1 Tax=Streptomyces flaveolus TaxID=67297 RepID=UPI003420C3A6
MTAEQRSTRTLTVGTTTIAARPVVAEFFGTLILVLFGVGSAVLGAKYIGPVGIALAFGLTLLTLAYALGPISGSHVNPAVTFGMLLARRLTAREAIQYWGAQLLGGIAGAALLLLVTAQVRSVRVSGAFGSNGYGSRSAVGVNIFGAFVAEILLTFLLVFICLAVTDRLALAGFEGLAIGLALAVANLVGIPLTGASVNPARSLGPAIFAGPAALSQLWLFLIAPMIGGALAAGVHRLTHPTAADRRENAQGADTGRKPT